jgi:hypothetical protein
MEKGEVNCCTYQAKFSDQDQLEEEQEEEAGEVTINQVF